MSENIIQFGRKAEAPTGVNDRVVWRCNCGCLTFFVRADQEIECAQCKTISADAGSWRARSPEEPLGAVEEVEADDVIVTDLGDPFHAIRRVLKKVDPDNVAALIVINNDGSLSTWGAADGKAQAGWMRRRVSSALKLIVGK